MRTDNAFNLSEKQIDTMGDDGITCAGKARVSLQLDRISITYAIHLLEKW